jgi:hypothetical protein
VQRFFHAERSVRAVRQATQMQAPAATEHR